MHGIRTRLFLLLSISVWLNVNPTTASAGTIRVPGPLGVAVSQTRTTIRARAAGCSEAGCSTLPPTVASSAASS